MVAIIYRQYCLFLLALSFFTRVPVHMPIEPSGKMLSEASRYFALIGLFIGLISAALFYFLLPYFPISIVVLVVMATNLLLTGAFHEDGWADVWDGFGGGWTVEQKLNIMKDSRLGTYGAAALFIILMLKYQALVAIAHSIGLVDGLLTSPINNVVVAVIVAHTLSRTLATSLIFSMTYVSEDMQAKVKPIAQHLSRTSLVILLLTAAAVLFTCLPWQHGVVLIVALLTLRLLLIKWFNKQLGGYTGDCLGAAQQCAEVIVYLVLLLLNSPNMQAILIESPR